MNSVSDKVDYVRKQGQTRDHHCHWPDCAEQVPPAKWGCARHWFKLPKPLRDRIWRTFDPGQEVKGTPSVAYLAAARDVQAWIKANAEPSAQMQLGDALAPAAPAVHAGVATLIDGRQVNSASDAWRHECEARYIAGLNAEARQGYLNFVRGRRGDAAGEQLAELVARIRGLQR
ncbi:hypothetical protein ACG02S_07960 [Roseateles sp. DC23W]|uniref:Uncharacterized protein n=1 Tax=Pelomonas dachongensis TaxID=3299029 RepID=A0ABW7EK68_9BURK